MSNKDEVIKAIKAVKVESDDWIEDILEMVTDKFAKGYLTAVVGHLYESLSANDRAFKSELLDVASWDIWDQE